MFQLQRVAREDGDEDGFRLWQSLSRQTELTAQLCSIMKDVKNVRGSAQKKVEKLRELLSGVFSELTNFDEVNLVTSLRFSRVILQCQKNKEHIY